MVTFKFSDGSSIQLDAALTEKHAAKVSLTKHPVESGVSPADHATLQPKVYSVDGAFTNAPLSKELQDERADRLFVSEMVDILFQVLEAREAITIETELRTHTNMMMTSLSMPNTADVGEAVIFSAEFEEVRFVETQTVRLAPRQTSVPQKPGDKDKQGKKVAKEATPEQTEQVSSWAHDIFGHTD